MLVPKSAYFCLPQFHICLFQMCRLGYNSIRFFILKVTSPRYIPKLYLLPDLMNMIANRMLNVLLVDDDEVDIMNVQRAFKKASLPTHLYIANNGIEALEMLRRQLPSNKIGNKNGGYQHHDPLPAQRLLILLDLNMPRMNGIEFLAELRADPDLKKIPVVVLTTSNAEQDRIDAYNSNVAGYILKPIAFTVFVEQMIVLNNYWLSCEMP